MESIPTIRPMVKDDVPQVAALERVCFRMPWSERALAGELKNLVAHYRVVELDDALIGYAGMWLICNEAHITNVAIAPTHRRKGYALKLMREMMRVARTHGASRMTLEVREHNYGAQALYQTCGFVVAGMRKRYYTDTGEAALIMWNDQLDEDTEPTQ